MEEISNTKSANEISIFALFVNYISNESVGDFSVDRKDRPVVAGGAHGALSINGAKANPVCYESTCLPEKCCLLFGPSQTASRGIERDTAPRHAKHCQHFSGSDGLSRNLRVRGLPLRCTA